MRDDSTDVTVTRALLACGAIACPLFILAFLAEGATRPGYDPLRHPISSLAIGELGWMQAANFLVPGSASEMRRTSSWVAIGAIIRCCRLVDSRRTRARRAPKGR